MWFWDILSLPYGFWDPADRSRPDLSPPSWRCHFIHFIHHPSRLHQEIVGLSGQTLRKSQRGSHAQNHAGLSWGNQADLTGTEIRTANRRISINLSTGCCLIFVIKSHMTLATPIDSIEPQVRFWLVWGECQETICDQRSFGSWNLVQSMWDFGWHGIPHPRSGLSDSLMIH